MHVRKYIDCDCDSADHTIRLTKWSDEDECYLEVQLHQTKNLFERVVSAIKYVFGYECAYGHWDCTSLDNDKRKQLIDFLKD